MKTKVEHGTACLGWYLVAIVAVLSSIASSSSAVVTIDTSEFIKEWTLGRSYTCSVSVSSPTIPSDQFHWSLAKAFPGDSIPPGLDVTDGSNDEIGELSYTPGLTGTFDFRIWVKNIHTGTDSGFADVSLIINAPPTFAATSLSNWSYGGNPYADTMPSPSGGTPGYRWTMSGQPNNLTINSLTGIISGTVDSAAVRSQPYTVTVTLYDTTNAFSSAAYSITMYDRPRIATNSPLTEWTATYPGYSLQLQTNSLILAPLVFDTVGDTFPRGLSLQTTGLINGTPVDTGQYRCTVKVEDPKHSSSTKVFTGRINDIVRISPSTLKNWSKDTTLSAEYVDTLFTTGGTGGIAKWDTTSGTLPPGLSIQAVNSTKAVLKGHPTIAGQYTFGVRARDAVGYQSQSNIYQVIIAAALKITTAGASLPEAVVGDTTYSFALSADGGTGQRQWKDSNNTLSGVGLRLNSTTGEITPNPTVLGPGKTVSVLIRVTDEGGAKSVKTFSVKIDAKPTLTVSDITICEGDTLPPLHGLDGNTDDTTLLSYSLQIGFNVLPSGIVMQSNGHFVGAATYTSAGSKGVHAIVCDPGPNIQCDTAFFVITVRNKDRAPVFQDTITNDTQIVYEGEYLHRLRADDADNDPLTYVKTAGLLPLGVDSVASDGTFPDPILYDLGDTLDHFYDPTFRVCDTVQQQCVGSNTNLCANKTVHIVVRPDRIPPHISWGPVFSSPQTIRVGVADRGAGVDAARIRYRKGNAKGTDTIGTELHLTPGNADTFSVVLPAGAASSAGLEIKVRMWDLKTNYGDTGWISVPVPFASGSETLSRDEWLGGNDSLWHLVSFPGMYSGNNKSIRAILESMSGLPRTKGVREDEWRLYRFLGTSGNLDLWDTLTSEDQSNEVRSGEGYWFRHIVKSFTLTLPAFATVSTAVRFPIPLRPGWNLIGNPYFFPLTIDRAMLQEANANSLSEARPSDPDDNMAQWQHILLDDTQAADSAVLEPFMGYAIYCERGSGDTLYLGSHYQAPASPMPGPEVWTVPITAYLNNSPVGRVAIGVVDALAQIAQSYDARPLGMFTRPSAILITDSVRGKFVRQMVPRGDDVHQWTLTVAPSEAGGLSLAWGSQVRPDPGQKLVLRDVLYDRVIDMSAQPVYDVINAAQVPAGRLVIYLGDSAAVMRAASAPMRTIPNSYRLYQNYPNPFNPSTTVAFDLPASSHVELAIFNILGERVRTLVSETRPAGSYVTAWDSRDDHGQSVASGVYFARLLTGGRAVTIKMALVK